MSSISSNFFTPGQLKSIRDAVTGNGEANLRLFSSAPAEKELEKGPQLQDVLILAPHDDIFKADTDLSETLEAHGYSIQDDFDDMGVTAQVTPEQAAKLKESGFQVFDNSPRPMWGMPKATLLSDQLAGDFGMPEVKPVEWLKADQVHEAGRTGKGQKVAVLDSGFQRPGFHLAGWKDVVTGSPTPVDKVGHGTHVASDILKTAPDAGIVAVKVMADDGSGRPSDIIAGIKYVLEQNKNGADIDIINMSLGGGPDGFPDELHPINRAVKLATESGVTVVAAAGNTGPKETTIGSPAEAPESIAVGALLNPSHISTFSSRGPTEGGLLKPDVMAPGEFITGWSVPNSEIEQTAQVVVALRAMPAPALKSLLEENPDLIMSLGLPPQVVDMPAEEVEKLVKPNLPPTFIPAPGLVAAPGTSFAAPLVSGVLASLEEEKDITPEASLALLRETADKVGQDGENVQGRGIVDALEALEFVKSGRVGAA